MLIGLLQPTSGTVTYDGEPIDAYDKEALHRQVGFVFQDSILFNLTLRENIAFSTAIPEQDMEKAIATAELHDFIATLPQGLDTVVSERGTSLSGGQKQRVMLARALALNPKVLLLDDFTARVDANTERAILENIQRELSRHHADLGDAEDRIGGGLRPDHPADGRRGAGHGNARAADGDVARIRADLRIAAEHQSL